MQQNYKQFSMRILYIILIKYFCDQSCAKSVDIGFKNQKPISTKAMFTTINYEIEYLKIDFVNKNVG